VNALSFIAMREDLSRARPRYFLGIVSFFFRVPRSPRGKLFREQRDGVAKWKGIGETTRPCTDEREDGDSFVAKSRAPGNRCRVNVVTRKRVTLA